MGAFVCLCWPELLALIIFTLWLGGSSLVTAVSAAISAIISVVASLLTSAVTILCPCIPISSFAISCCCCCRRKKNPSAAKKKTARKVNRNFGKPSARDGVLTVSPPGGKNKGKIPEKLGQASSGKKQSKIPNVNASDSQRALRAVNTDDEWGVSSSPNVGFGNASPVKKQSTLNRQQTLDKKEASFKKS